MADPVVTPQMAEAGVRELRKQCRRLGLAAICDPSAAREIVEAVYRTMVVVHSPTGPRDLPIYVSTLPAIAAPTGARKRIG